MMVEENKMSKVKENTPDKLERTVYALDISNVIQTRVQAETAQIGGGWPPVIFSKLL
ncbi:hypothetical protein CVS40_12402 [Lucilia cuprina]|nr:hypothetical protein CVS40_12402 [Lucilia cuprina]